MDKSSSSSSPSSITSRKRRFPLVACLIVTALLYQYTTLTTTRKEFSWFDIKPSEQLKLTKCFDDHLCARLSLPLDYQAQHGPKTDIAIRVLPAKDKANYKGAILVNPGGPGGSGTEFIERAGKNLSTVIGPQYDIVGFDPRGIGASTPSAKCFASTSQFEIWNLQSGPSLNNRSTPAMIAYKSQREHVNAQLCLERIGGNGKFDPKASAEEWGIGNFMSTPSVATDMLRISEQFGQEKLKYWGFSYGTILGQYFASIYPDKVDRLIIDGVFDGDNYRDGLWNSNLKDTDKVFQSFFDNCYEAGPDKCNLWQDSSDKIKERVYDIIRSVKESPVPLLHTKNGPAVITSNWLRSAIFRALYSPLYAFGLIADTLHGIESGNATALTTVVDKLTAPGFRCNCSYTPGLWETNDPQRGVACGDAYTDRRGDWNEWVQSLHNLSNDFAPSWTDFYYSCKTWSIRPKWRYTGPFSAQTSHPLLILQPQYDTVCPLSDAQKVAKRFNGSRILQQNSAGHCTLAAPSLCTAKVVRAYFDNGTLPEEGTQCETDKLPFVGRVGKAFNTLSVEDQELSEALDHLVSAVPYF